MKFFDLERRKQSCIASLPFRAAHSFRLTNHVYVAWRKQMHDALIKSEIFNRVLNLALFDVPDAITSQTSLCCRSRIEPADIPKATIENFP